MSTAEDKGKGMTVGLWDSV